MAEQESSKDLISVLWSGADILRSKMDAYIEALKDESAEELKDEIKSSCHYVILSLIHI